MCVLKYFLTTTPCDSVRGEYLSVLSGLLSPSCSNIRNKKYYQRVVFVCSFFSAKTTQTKTRRRWRNMRSTSLRKHLFTEGIRCLFIVYWEYAWFSETFKSVLHVTYRHIYLSIDKWVLTMLVVSANLFVAMIIVLLLELLSLLCSNS